MSIEQSEFDATAQMEDDLKKINAEINAENERSEDLLERFAENNTRLENLPEEVTSRHPEETSSLRERISTLYKDFFIQFSEKHNDPELAKMKIMFAGLGLGTLAAVTNIAPEFLNETIKYLPEQIQTFLQSPESAFTTWNLMPGVDSIAKIDEIRSGQEITRSEAGVRMASALANVLTGTSLGVFLGITAEKITKTFNTLGKQYKRQNKEIV
ncbi:MAG: hypothetical protein HGB03_01310 [Candidatus Yonathbacteria bacterium]|nr:hypothetical protein [Candidatus Yonathbacteria bacterium]NTW47902.1 hypothetical protein [Candidatus Yonathbacteria bacterium]